MDQSLSVVLPVFNAESTLVHRVGELLEILPDINRRFEIIIVDDGSTDSTSEIAHDLSTQFPQITLIRHAARLGSSLAVNVGLEQAAGEVVLIQEPDSPISAAHLRQLWDLRDDDQLVMAGIPSGPANLDPELVYRLSSWGAYFKKAARKKGKPGVRMIRRQAIHSLVEV